jgi:RNA polymerase sigma-70 factor (ECF subfamily)
LSEYKDLPDIKLIEEVARFKSRALEELYDRYSPIVYTMAKKIAPDEKSAEEIVIDVFSIIWKRAGDIDFTQNCVYTWIITLTRNKAIDLLKRSRSPEATLDYYDNQYEETFILPHISHQIEQYDIRQIQMNKTRIENALDKLSDAQKYVIHLAYYEGYNINEISEKLGIPKETVRSKIYTALKMLHDNFEAEL